MMASDQPASPPVPWRFRLRTFGRLIGMLGVMVVGVWTYLVNSENRRTAMGRARWLSRTCEHVLKVLQVRVRATGTLPQGVMLAPNHVGYLDIIVLAALSPTAFVAKAEVAHWPIFGWFAARAGTLFLRRERKSDLVRVGERIAPVLAEGINLVVFLEGTSTDGRTVRTFRPGLLEPVVRLGGQAVPTAISYRVSGGYDARVDVAWWGTMPLLPHLVGLMGIPWIEVEVDWGAARGHVEDRKVLAGELERIVREAVEERSGA